MQPMFTGSIVALVTPFDEAGEIDFRALETLVRFHLEAGTAGLVVAGTTGESATLRTGEFEALLDAVIGQVAGQLPVIAGTGTAATERTIQLTRMAEDCGADAVLVVTPYYVRPTQHGMIAHFTAVAAASDLPLILYNVPSRTAVDLLPETVEVLAGNDRVVGIKEAVGKAERFDELSRRCPAGFVLLSGDDHTFLAAMRHGARGVISVAANVVPKAMSGICRAAVQQDWASAAREEAGLQQLFDHLMIESNPIPVKWALHELSICSPAVRLPLTELSVRFRQPLRQCLENMAAASSG